ncbi:MAG: cytochrome oxidase assembly protein [Actinomycetia bacterium]|nr:cytochrome oxidase assembly protein [Actinomycetes bacterium]
MRSDLGALAVIAALVAAYVAGVTRMRDHTPGTASPSPVHIGAFAAGGITLIVALASPLDARADTSLTAHMVQHMLLLGVAAPLLVVGDVLGVLPWVLPDDRRRRWQRPLRRMSRSRHGRVAFWAAVGLVAQTAVVVAWHIPKPYDAAAANPALHAVEHASFIGVSMFFWWILLGAGRGDRFAAGVLALFVGTLPLSALGVFMTLARTPWYPRYIGSSTASALRDQQVAGVIMWGFGGMAAAVGAAAFFASWLQSLERRDPARGPGVREPRAPEPGRVPA